MGGLIHVSELENSNWPLRHFVPSELQCKCCGRVWNSDAAEKARGLLDDLRELMGEPLRITSATRCPSHNETVGGARNSQHLTGRAFDIYTVGYGQGPTFRHRLVWGAGYLGFGGIGIYPAFIHVDTRPLVNNKPTVWIG